MKRPLLKPPSNDGDILLIPGREEVSGRLSGDRTLAVCHQPYFFHPGVSLKYFFLEEAPLVQKKMLFLDTDTIDLSATFHSKWEYQRLHFLKEREAVLAGYRTPDEKNMTAFLDELAKSVERFFPDKAGIFDNLQRFRDIFLAHAGQPSLRDVLAGTFLEYCGIDRPFRFVSDLTREDPFKEFVGEIYARLDEFVSEFNRALEDYQKEFRFRFKNFPFPPLEEGELPFWLIDNGVRRKFRKADLPEPRIGESVIFPRASTLTLFLRLYECDDFVHGIGGGNYEWVIDRMIERFFNKSSQPYIVLSGSFYLPGCESREMPYFLFSPEDIRQKARTLWKGDPGKTESGGGTP